MSDRPIFIVSDVHLGAIPPEAEAHFLRWLGEEAPGAAQLVINGDLFDFWFEYRSVIPRGYTRVLGALASLADRGIPLTIMGGNHDWWGGDFLEKEIGATFLRDPEILDLHGTRTLLAHGDGLGAGDAGYRVLRRVLRSPLSRFAFRWLHPDLGAAIARRVSRTELRSAPPRSEDPRPTALRRWATEMLVNDPTLGLVAVGHSHLPERVEIAPSRFYINTGDWIRHRSYVVLRPGELPALERWKG